MDICKVVVWFWLAPTCVWGCWNVYANIKAYGYQIKVYDSKDPSVDRSVLNEVLRTYIENKQTAKIVVKGTPDQEVIGVPTQMTSQMLQDPGTGAFYPATYVVVMSPEGMEFHIRLYNIQTVEPAKLDPVVWTVRFDSRLKVSTIFQAWFPVNAHAHSFEFTSQPAQEEGVWVTSGVGIFGDSRFPMTLVTSGTKQNADVLRLQFDNPLQAKKFKQYLGESVWKRHFGDQTY